MNKTQLAKQYNAFAVKFSRLNNEENNISREAFYRQINFPLKNKTVLDLACGDGTDMLFYQKRGAVVFGIDASEKMIGLAKSKVTDADIRAGFMERLPYSDNFFDAVFSKYAIQTSAHMDLIFKEAARVLKPDGIFIYLVTHPLRQFLEKCYWGGNRDYFKKKIIVTPLFGDKVTVREPTHTFNEYFCPGFLALFDIEGFKEARDPFSAEMVDKSIYPGFFILKARKRKGG